MLRGLVDAMRSEKTEFPLGKIRAVNHPLQNCPNHMVKVKLEIKEEKCWDGHLIKYAMCDTCGYIYYWNKK